MELALTIFNIGAGIGLLAVGLALLFLAWQLVPLLRETRALVVDLRRTAAALDAELRPLLASAGELTRNVEVLSEDVAVKLDRLTDLMNSLQTSLDEVQITAVPRRSPDRSVESWEAPEETTFR